MSYRDDAFARLVGPLAGTDDSPLWASIERLPLTASLYDVYPQGGLLPHLAKSLMMPVTQGTDTAAGVEAAHVVQQALQLGAGERLWAAVQRVLEVSTTLDVGRLHPQMPYAAHSDDGQSRMLTQILLATADHRHRLADSRTDLVLLALAVLLPRRVSKLDYGSSSGRRLHRMTVEHNVRMHYLALAREFASFLSQHQINLPGHEAPTHNVWSLRPPDLYDAGSALMPEHLVFRISAFGLVEPMPSIYDPSAPGIHDHEIERLIQAWGRSAPATFLKTVRAELPRSNDRHRLRYYAHYLRRVWLTATTLPDRPTLVVTKISSPRGITLDMRATLEHFTGRKAKQVHQSTKLLSLNARTVRESGFILQ